MVRVALLVFGTLCLGAVNMEKIKVISYQPWFLFLQNFSDHGLQECEKRQSKKEKGLVQGIR